MGRPSKRSGWLHTCSGATPAISAAFHSLMLCKISSCRAKKDAQGALKVAHNFHWPWEPMMSSSFYILLQCWRSSGGGTVMNGPQTTLPSAERHTCQAHSILSNISISQRILQAGNLRPVDCTCMIPLLRLDSS